MLAVALLLVLGASLASADTYSGGLYGNDGGLVGTGAWVTEPVPPDGWTSPGLTWNVIQRSAGYWHYAYQLKVPVGAVSHFDLEASEGFGCKDIFGDSGDFNQVEIGWLDPATGNSNPGMPERMYGIKFDEAVNTTFNVAFDSWRAPVWGDFYAKDGKAHSDVFNAIWNSGFTHPDSDPNAPPANGALNGHLLRPDTTVTPIPEPGTLALLGLGLGAAGVRLRRRKRA